MTSSEGDRHVGKERILVAEDEPHLREVLRLQLEVAGFEVFEARDGEQAVESDHEVVLFGCGEASKPGWI